MELKEFIRQTLTEIEEGVHEANEAYRKVRGLESNAFIIRANIGPKLEDRGIEFDVAVTTTSGTGTAGKAKVDIHVVELSTGGESRQAKESVSRIKFVVAVHEHLA